MEKTVQIRALLVEDQYPFLHEEILKAHNGIQFMTVSKAEEAILLLRENVFDVVIMDIRLPGGMNGIEALQEIRKHDADIPVIMFTAWGDAKTRKQAEKAGCNDFFTKPPNYGRLYRRIIELAVQKKQVVDKEDLSEIDVLKKRLHALRVEESYKGMDTPVHIKMEIEDIEARLAELKK